MTNAYLTKDKTPKSGREFVDLIDLIAFFWRSKIWIAVGAMAGLIIGFAINSGRPDGNIVATVPVVIESAGQIATRSVIAQMNQAITRPDFRELFVKNLDQAVANSLSTKANLPFRFLPSPYNSGIVMEVLEVHSDPSGALPLKYAKALATPARELNKKISPLKGVDNGFANPNLNSNLEKSTMLVLGKMYAEWSDTQYKMSALKTKVERRTGVRLTQERPMNETAPDDYVIRMLAQYPEKFSSEERDSFLKENAELNATFRTKQLKYELVVRELLQPFSDQVTQLIDQATGNVGQVPVLAPDIEAYRALVSAGNFEHTEYKKPFVLFISCVIGSIVATFVFATFLYLQKNRNRLRAIFA